MLPCSPVDAQGRRIIPYTIEELLPHSGPMILLDKVLEIGEGYILTALIVRADGLFSDPDHRVPAWVGMEYMAQSVAAYSGYHRKCQGRAVDLGFLLGTRYYQCSVSGFATGTELVVRAEKLIDGANGMSVFDCRIEGRRILAASQLNVFLPADSSIYTGRRL